MNYIVVQLHSRSKKSSSITQYVTYIVDKIHGSSKKSSSTTQQLQHIVVQKKICALHSSWNSQQLTYKVVKKQQVIYKLFKYKYMGMCQPLTKHFYASNGRKTCRLNFKFQKSTSLHLHYIQFGKYWHNQYHRSYLEFRAP